MSSAPQTAQSYSCPACGKKRPLDAKGAGSAVECTDCHAWHLMPFCDVPTKLELPAPPRLEPAQVLEQELATASLLDHKLPKTLLGQHFTLGCYARNPFRLLGVNATSDADDCERVARRMRNRAKAGIASTGTQIAVHLGYDGATVESDSAEIVTAMKNSRR